MRIPEARVKAERRLRAALREEGGGEVEGALGFPTQVPLSWKTLRPCDTTLRPCDATLWPCFGKLEK